MPDDGRRYEVIDGVLIVSAAPGLLHQRAVGRLYRLLDDECPAEFEVVVAPFAVGLAEDTEMQPDVVVGRREHFTDKELPTAPALAVEVLSPSTRLIDLNLKRARFERAYTPAFWVVEPAALPAQARLIAWRLGKDGKYRQIADVMGDEEFTADVPFPVKVVPASLVR
jgi:Uma2 family endonuclease